MLLDFKYGYLTDGTKVKITEELFSQFKIWESQGVYVSSEYKDVLKIQDNEWLNSQRNFYLKLHKKGTEDGHLLINTLLGNEDKYDINFIDKVLILLDTRTKNQRSRFIKHYFYGISPKEIAKQEQRSVQVITRSLRKVRLFLMENLQD
jgi:hypothetical protein